VLGVSVLKGCAASERDDQGFLTAETTMTSKDVPEVAFKRLVKEALVEALQEHREFLQEMIVETLEDCALAEAIQQGRGARRVSRKAVFDLLGGS
jgi:hypothetical protein